MMKKLICIILCLLCLAGCAAQPKPEPDDAVLCAMYIPLGDGYILISDDGTPFTLSSFDGLSTEALSAGDILAITNPGDMAASYPGILYGYDKLELAEEGKPEDIELHRAVLDDLMNLSLPDSAPPDAVLPDGLYVNRAMYVPFGDGSYVMIDDLGSVYTVRFPADMVGTDGQPITPDDLKAGSLVDIYGNGIMLDSYPGQYPNVSRIVVVKEGDPADIEQYRGIIDGLYTEPQAALEPYALHLEYAIEDAVAYTQATLGGYSWEVDNGDGTTTAVIADASHILQWSDMQNIYIAQPTPVRITCPEQLPHRMSCVRWPAEQFGKPAEPEDWGSGEIVTLEQNDAEYLLLAEPGYVYQLRPAWTQGTAEFGFIAE